jgi:predicted homoserine dehydrogenase-like protein
MMSRTGAVVTAPAIPPSGHPTRVGLVGCGYWGPNLVRVFAALPQAELVMVCDLVLERLERGLGWLRVSWARTALPQRKLPWIALS